MERFGACQNIDSRMNAKKCTELGQMIECVLWVNASKYATRRMHRCVRWSNKLYVPCRCGDVKHVDTSSGFGGKVTLDWIPVSCPPRSTWRLSPQTATSLGRKSTSSNSTSVWIGCWIYSSVQLELVAFVRLLQHCEICCDSAMEPSPKRSHEAVDPSDHELEDTIVSC